MFRLSRILKGEELELCQKGRKRKQAVGGNY